jgi:spermidine synthase
MAAVYARRRDRTPRVQVDVGRRGRALRIDGSFASWYTPGRPLTDSVWDALAAPLLLLPPARRRRILILGMGGGSAARLVRAIAPRAHIVGVERDSEVVRAARRWFDLASLGSEIVEADALGYLRRVRRRFDLVIEDLFVGHARSLRKPEGLPEPGLALAARCTAPGGLVVSNTLDESAAVARVLRSHFPAVLRIDVAGYDNRVFVGAPAGLTGRDLRAAVSRSHVLGGTSAGLAFRRLR